MIRIAIDAMGGDNAPGANVRGALDALSRYSDISIALFGVQEAIERELDGLEYDAQRLQIVHCGEVISNHDAPVSAIRSKRDSSIVRGLRSVADGQTDGFISAGSTGAVLAGGLLILRTIQGIHRPALAPMIPTAKNPALLIDCGANMDCKPIHLTQFGLMGSEYMKVIAHMASPRVGLVNVGSEDEKGNELVRATFPRLKAAPIQFIGNIEAREIPGGDVDVIVCDAFVGNVILKLMEGMAVTLVGMLKNALTSRTLYKLPALMLKGAFRKFKKSMDYEEHGGAPLLGVRGCVFKSHGSSSQRAIANTVGQVRDFVQSGVIGAIAQQIENSGLKYDREQDA